MMGKMLPNGYVDERWRPVAYLLKSLNEIEQNYEIHNK